MVQDFRSQVNHMQSSFLVMFFFLKGGTNDPLAAKDVSATVNFLMDGVELNNV